MRNWGADPQAQDNDSCDIDVFVCVFSSKLIWHDDERAAQDYHIVDQIKHAHTWKHTQFQGMFVAVEVGDVQAVAYNRLDLTVSVLIRCPSMDIDI